MKTNKIIESLTQSLEKIKITTIHTLEDGMKLRDQYQKQIIEIIKQFHNIQTEQQKEKEKGRQQNQQKYTISSDCRNLQNQISSVIQKHHNRTYQSLQSLLPIMRRLKESITPQKIHLGKQTYEEIQAKYQKILQGQKKQAHDFENEICHKVHDFNGQIFNDLVSFIHKLLQNHNHLLQSFESKLKQMKLSRKQKSIENSKSIKALDNQFGQL